jgi:hypothetical protein
MIKDFQNNSHLLQVNFGILNDSNVKCKVINEDQHDEATVIKKLDGNLGYSKALSIHNLSQCNPQHLAETQKIKYEELKEDD